MTDTDFGLETNYTPARQNYIHKIVFSELISWWITYRLHKHILLELISRKLHYTYSFVIQRITCNISVWEFFSWRISFQLHKINSVHTSCIVKTSGFTRAFEKENSQKSGLLWASPFTMHLVCALLAKECFRNWCRNNFRLECTLSFLSLSFGKRQGKPPKNKDFFIPTEPLKSLAKKGKTRVHAKGVVLSERACFCLLSILSAFYNTPPPF